MATAASASLCSQVDGARELRVLSVGSTVASGPSWPSVEMPPFSIADGPFAPNWDSLRKHYECPEWFRDAKLGFWAHWGPQSQAMAGDWYTRNMYIQGHPQYQHHLDNYGHPSVHGAKDLMCEWKADRFDPEDLITLYKEAGGRYFCFMVNHHDNFDSWNSKYQPWNCVKVGPQKDLCRMWADASRKHGLKFGVTFHSTPYRCWNEFMPAWYGSDQSGPKAGLPYDGAVATKADGVGKLWEGLDPRDLYGPLHKTNDPCPEFVQQFLLRVDDLLRKYEPDLLYFDDAVTHVQDTNERLRLDAMLGMPDLITQIAAHFYNLNLMWHHGQLEAVLNIKHVASEPIMEQTLTSAVVNDFEMNDPDKPFEFPWQTDASVGSWHYRVNDRYRSAKTMIHKLVCIVANNGNLLLGVPPKGDGTIDDQPRRTVEEMGVWLKTNGGAIFSTRPWRKSREANIRFTRSKDGKTLYAISLSWPEKNQLRIDSLSEGPERVTNVSLLGHPSKLTWRQTNQGLAIDLPNRQPCEHAFTFAIALQD